MENLKEEFANNEEFRNTVLSTVKDNGYHLYSDEEFNEVVSNKANTFVSKEVSEALKNNHTKLEESVFNIVGEPKLQDEKSYDYAARNLATYKEKLSDLNNQIEQLNAKLKDNSSDEVLKQQVEKLQADLQSKEAEYTDIISKKDQEFNNINKSFMFDTAVKGLKFDESIDTELLSAKIDQIKINILSSSDLKDNKLVLLDTDGKVLTDGKKGHNPMDINDYLSYQLGKYLKQDSVSGTGLKPDNRDRNNSYSDAEVYIRSKNPKNEADVRNAAKEFAEQNGRKYLADKEISQAKLAVMASLNLK